MAYWQLIEKTTTTFEGETKTTERIREELKTLEKAEWSLKGWKKEECEETKDGHTRKREFYLKEIEGHKPNGYHVVMIKGSDVQELKTISDDNADNFSAKWKNQGYEVKKYERVFVEPVKQAAHGIDFSKIQILHGEEEIFGDFDRNPLR